MGFLEVQAEEVVLAANIKLTQLSNPPFSQLYAEGWRWIVGEDTLPYITNELIEITEKEAEGYYEAGNDLYDMFVKAAEHVIKNDLFEALDINPNLIPLIKYTWENDNNWHLYGRFDLSGGINGEPIKLIEFNADTATCLPETAIIQWAQLNANNYNEAQQFNTLYETLVNSLKALKENHPEKHPSMLFSIMADFPEDYSNVELLCAAAKEAGFETAIENIEKVDFSIDEGIFKQDVSDGSFIQYDFWFKLIPWEFIEQDEPDLLEVLSSLIMSDKIVVLNPAYTMLFQSKGILKILWDLYPNHPLLLETSFEPLLYTKQVQKVMLGREGANVKIIDNYGIKLEETTGDYSNQKCIYQSFTEFSKDIYGNYYQAGVFYSGESCGLGFRKGGQILDNKAQFCGHIIKG